MTERLYVDGGVIGVNPSPCDGTWAWIRVDAEDNIIASDSGYVRQVYPECPLPVSNNVSELVAALQGLLALPEGWKGQFYSDSRITLGRVFQGWALAGVPDCLRRLILPAKFRPVEVTWWLLDGHPTAKHLAENRGKRGNQVSKWNAWCDKECSRLAKVYQAKAT